MALACVLGHPAAGHINPNLPLIDELRHRGERLVYYATEPFRKRIEGAGAEFRPYGAHELFERSLGAAGMLGGMEGLIETTAEIVPGLLDQLRQLQPDYLLVEAHAVWGNLLSQ